MRLPRLAIENHQFTFIMIILLTLAGVVSFLTMPRSEDPQISPAGSSVTVVYPGANPVDLEEMVIDPIEKAINELEDIKQISSSAEDGVAVVGVEFLSGADPDEKYSDVVQKVNSIRDKLPDEILSTDVLKWSISDVNLLQVALVSDSASYRTLEKAATELEKSFEKVPGVKKAETWAFPEQQLRVSLNLQKMALNHIPLNQVMGAIQAANRIIPGGDIDIGSRRFNVQTSGSYQSIDDLRNTIISSASGNVVHLKDIADVEFNYEDQAYRARFDGQRAVFITASQKEGTNIFDVTDGLKQKLADFISGLPASVQMHIVFDQSTSVSHRVNGFFLNLLQGLILVGVIILLAVSVRASLIVILVIPISILIGIGFVDLSNFGLEQMSIAGLVIALGLLVDNAIVVTENISRYMKLGYSKKESAIRGTSQIAWAVVSSTATTLLAFVPIIMMKNITGDFIRSMPVTVVFTLSASLLVALTLTPYLSGKFLRAQDSNGKNRLRQRMNHFIETRYRTALNFSLTRPKLILAVALGVFFASLSLFPLVGVSFFPKAEKPQFIININAPAGTSFDKTDSIAREVESVLAKRPEVRLYATNIGHGNPRIYYNIFPRSNAPYHAQIFIETKQNDLQIFKKLLVETREQFANYAGARIEVKEFEQGPPVEAPVAIRIVGENLDVLKKIAANVEKMVESADGTININNPLSTSKIDLSVKINREKAGMFGIPLAEIDRTVRAGIAGLPVSQYRDADGKDYDIVVRLPFREKPRISDFDKIYVASPGGAMIPLRQLANLKFKATPMLIVHHNLERSVTVTADVAGNASVDKVTSRIIEKLKNYRWPHGYHYYLGGELESREESFGGMAKAVLVALIGIFGVLVLQFRSYLQPLIVFATIPLAIIGSIVALLVTGHSFSFTAFVGLTSLVGIVVNNAIILVDYTNQLRESGTDLLPALKEAGETRFMPIILTTATTIGGLLPLTLGGGTMWAPMGWTIIGGLAVSTVLTLLVVPVLYKIFTREITKEKQNNQVGAGE